MGQLTRLHFDDRADFDRWQEYILARDDTQCSDLAEWRPLFRELYGFADHSFAYLEHGRVAGAMSLYHVRSPLMGKMLVTSPFYGYGGLYWESEAGRDALLRQAEATAGELGVDYVEFRTRQALPAPYRSNPGFAEFNLELPATADEAWSDRLSSNARQNIRKARTHDLRFRLTRDPGPCFDLLRRTLRAHGTPFHGQRFFRLLDAHLGNRVRYAEVWQGNRLAAGGVLIGYKDSVVTPHIGSLARYRGLRSNYRLYWGIVETCLAEGIARFEMGRSPRGSTHAQFKNKWGCVEMPVHYNYRVFDARRGYRSVSDPTPIQRMAATVWKRLPLALTTALGPRLYRHIP